MYSTLHIEQQEGIATLWMNRPEVFNAFNETLVTELDAACQQLDHDPAVRVVILAGRGKHFSAGADLNWMKQAGQASMAENLADAQRLADMLGRLAHLRKPTLARVHGLALGGGMGLAAACDICIASTAAGFATSEVRFGIIPSAISPYVIRAIGERQAYRYFQTAERFPASTAQAIGLVHEVVEAEALDQRIHEISTALLLGGPNAQAAAKELIRAVAHQPVDQSLKAETARRIAQLRATDEAREGLDAFLSKRPADWGPLRAAESDPAPGR